MSDPVVITEPARPRSRRHGPLGRCGRAYAVLVALAIVTVRVGGDRWGWATAVAYGPRAVVLVPGLLLLGVAAWRRGPWRLAAAAVAAAVVGVLGVAVPWRTFTAGPSPVTTIRLLELNANDSGTNDQPYDPPRLADLIRRDAPDVLAMAEWPGPDALPPPPAGGAWHTRQAFDVLLASRYPIVRSAVWSARPLGGEGTVVGGELIVDGRPLWCFALHLETPRRGFDPVLQRQPGAMGALARSIDRRRRLSAAAAAFVRATAGGEDTLVAGDFNEVPDGAIFRRTWGPWADAFDRAGWGPGWTKWQDGWGVRIDHVLVDHRWRASRCRVGPDVGSDHLPLLADLARPPP